MFDSSNSLRSSAKDISSNPIEQISFSTEVCVFLPVELDSPSNDNSVKLQEVFTDQNCRSREKSWCLIRGRYHLECIYQGVIFVDGITKLLETAKI